MNGGPSQMDTFDLKPGHANGGPFKAIHTSVTGVRISEHLPKLAQLADHLALVRSMSTKEGDHGRASYFLRTGYMPQGQVRYPTLGSLVAKELADEEAELPSFVSIAPFRFLNQAAYGPGFLGHEYAPLIVGESNRGQQVVRPGMNQEDAALRVKDLDLPDGIVRRRADARLSLLEPLNSEFIDSHPVGPAAGHRSAIERAVKLMRSDEVKAFQLDAEPPRLRDGYGRNPFGQGCLLARRLIERGVPFVEVTLNSPDGQQAVGWDTHAQNFDRVRQLSEVLDAGWSTLIRDLQQRGLLETTAIVWMGEFGRTPKINANAGRDHFPNGVDNRARRRGHQRGSGHRSHECRRYGRGGPARFRARLNRDRLPGARYRSEDSKRVKRRPADPDRRHSRQTDHGGFVVSQMRRFSLLLVALLLVPFTSRGQGPLLKLPDDVFDRSRGEDVVDVLYFATGGAAIVRLHVTVESQVVSDLLGRLRRTAPRFSRPRRRPCFDRRRGRPRPLDKLSGQSH